MIWCTDTEASTLDKKMQNELYSQRSENTTKDRYNIVYSWLTVDFQIKALKSSWKTTGRCTIHINPRGKIMTLLVYCDTGELLNEQKTQRVYKYIYMYGGSLQYIR